MEWNCGDLALSNSVNGYIAKVEEDTLSSYPHYFKNAADISKTNCLRNVRISRTRIKILIKAGPLMQKETQGQMMVQEHITVRIGQKTGRARDRRVSKRRLGSTRKNDLVAFKSILTQGQQGRRSCLCDNIQLRNPTAHLPDQKVNPDASAGQLD